MLGGRSGPILTFSKCIREGHFNRDIMRRLAGICIISVCLYVCMSRYVNVCQCMFMNVNACQCMLMYVNECQCMSMYVNACQSM